MKCATEDVSIIVDGAEFYPFVRALKRSDHPSDVGDATLWVQDDALHASTTSASENPRQRICSARPPRLGCQSRRPSQDLVPACNRRHLAPPLLSESQILQASANAIKPWPNPATGSFRRPYSRPASGLDLGGWPCLPGAGALGPLCHSAYLAGSSPRWSEC